MELVVDKKSESYSGHMNTSKGSQESERESYIPKSILSFWFL